MLFPEYQDKDHSSPDLSVAKASLPKTNSTNNRRTRSRSSSPSPERAIANHGRSKSKKKRSSSSISRRDSSHSREIVDNSPARRPNSDVLRDTSNSTMANSQATKVRKMQAEKRAMLAQLAEKGLTLDENGTLVDLPRNGDSGDDTDPNATDNGDSDSENEGQATRKMAARGSRSSKAVAKPSKAVANMQAQLAVTKHKRSKKKKKDEEMDETVVLIRECVHNKLWALSKFVSGEKSQDKAAAMCLHLLDLDGFTGKGKHYDAQRAQWIKAYGPIVTAAINTHRSYVQNRCKEACFRWMDDHQGTLPTEDVLKKCLERKIDLKVMDEVEVMKWFWDDLIAMAAGNMDDWHPDKRHYLPLSTGAPPNSDSMPYITSSTEAIAVTFIENNRSKWPAIYAAKHVYKKAKEIRVKAKVEVDDNGVPTDEFTWHKGIVNGVLLCNGEKYMTKFTETAAGQQEFNGWSKEGRDYNVAMKKLNETARKAKGTKKFEKAILDMIRADYGKTAPTALEERNSKRRKTAKAKAPVVDDEDDGMEF